MESQLRSIFNANICGSVGVSLPSDQVEPGIPKRGIVRSKLQGSESCIPGQINTAGLGGSCCQLRRTAAKPALLEFIPYTRFSHPGQRKQKTFN